MIDDNGDMFLIYALGVYNLKQTSIWVQVEPLTSYVVLVIYLIILKHSFLICKRGIIMISTATKLLPKAN